MNPLTRLQHIPRRFATFTILSILGAWYTRSIDSFRGI